MQNMKKSSEKITPEQLAYSNLLSYGGMLYPKYHAEPMHKLIATALEAAEAGIIRRLLIFAPPQHGKTMLTSEFFPPWAIGRNPHWKIIAATFNQTRANEVGGVVRNYLTSDIQKRVFPNCHISPDTKSVHHIATMQRGHYYSIGVSGTGTGRGANCLPAETMIPTLIDGKKKTLDIATLYLLQYHQEIKVLAFDHKTNCLLYKRVIAARRTFTNELYEITTNSGYKIRATGDHRFFIHGQGYIKAKDLRPKDRFTIRQNKINKSMYALRENKGRAWPIMLGMLQFTQKNRYRNNLRMVWEEDNKESLRNTESNQKGIQRFILFPKMLTSSSRSQKPPQMLNMWRTNRNKNTQILFGRMQTSSQSSPQIAEENMPLLWERIPTTHQQNTILFTGLRQRCSFRTNDRYGKLSLQRWNELYQTIQRDETPYSKTRQCTVLSMQKVHGTNYNTKKRLAKTTNKKQCSSTSYRRRHNKQYSRKPDLIMCNLPCSTPQITQDTISTIRQVSTNSLPVYDIQVEGTSNFFANQILTHNCFLIDDPFKGREDAESKVAREKVKEWYKAVAYTRLRPDNRIIIINTRWHLDDLSGFVLREHAHENWKILDLKAIAEEGDILKREVGEALCPSMYPRKSLDIIKEVEGTYNWESLYQQRPIAREGGMVKYEWIKHYSEPPRREDIIKTIISWDTAYKAEQLNDPTAATVWVITKNGYYLIDVINKRMEYPDLLRKVKTLHNIHHPSGHLIEGRASGQSLIQDLKRNTTIPVIEISTKNVEKEIRFDSTTTLFESGKVFLPEKAHWLSETEDQICLFPSHAFDDIADSVSQFLNWVNKPRYVRRPRSALYWK